MNAEERVIKAVELTKLIMAGVDAGLKEEKIDLTPREAKIMGIIISAVGASLSSLHEALTGGA